MTVKHSSAVLSYSSVGVDLFSLKHGMLEV